MNTEPLEELENAENWDFDSAETRPPVKAARAVVSVPFSRQDYEKVALCAEQTGERISEFIREGALQRAAEHVAVAMLSSYSFNLSWRTNAELVTHSTSARPSVVTGFVPQSITSP